MSKNIVTPGNQYAEKGTTPWADWQRSRLKIALKDTHFEARQIVGIIEEMCAGAKPAWYLMTREDGSRFRTFEQFVTAKDGLSFDYVKFRNMALSEPGIMNERKYDLLTKAPDRQGERTDTTSSAGRLKLTGQRGITQLRAINRADPFVRDLYVAGLIDAKLAELLGPDKDDERKAKAQRALSVVHGIARNGDDAAYRKAVNDAVRKAFGISTPTPLDLAQKAFDKLSEKDRRKFDAWRSQQEPPRGQ